MPRGAYFVKERVRHNDLRLVRLTFREARRITRLLLREAGISVEGIERLAAVRGRRLGDCRTRRGVVRIRYRPVEYRGLAEGRVTFLTVIHEVAHAIDHKARPVAARRHCAAHAAIVDTLAFNVRARGWHRAVPPPPATNGRLTHREVRHG
jgi:hypothetical protein